MKYFHVSRKGKTAEKVLCIKKIKKEKRKEKENGTLLTKCHVSKMYITER